MADKTQLEQELYALKAQAYDVLAELEYTQVQYKNRLEELQKGLQNVNKQISVKAQAVQAVQQNVKEAADPVLLTEKKE